MIRRTEIPGIIDGTHPTAGQTVAYIHQGLIVAWAAAVALKSVSDLPLWLRFSLTHFEFGVLILFTLEYVLRVVCARQPLRYILSFWGIVDLLACLPLLLFVDRGFSAVRLLRLLRLIAVLKLLHSNRALKRLQWAVHRSGGELTVFAFLAAITLYIAAAGIYIFENEAQPERFSSIPACLWWAVVSFTTVGYGDMYPVTVGGRLFASVVLLLGLAVIAVPTAVITSALVQSDVEQLEDSIGREVEEELLDELRPRSRRPTALKRKRRRRF